MALALSRELTPVVTAIIVAGRVGSAFAAELGTMQVGGGLRLLCDVCWAYLSHGNLNVRFEVNVHIHQA
jgi:hypothetical protein